jgi:hypothetical protein
MPQRDGLMPDEPPAQPWRGRIALTLAGLVVLGPPGLAQASSQLVPRTMARAGTVHERFHSYNVEMVEVTGGRFWKPYGHGAADAAPTPGQSPREAMAALFEYRPPIDLSQPRLRALARALGPAFVRVSGTWANSTYFYDADGPPPASPPAGFNSVLTRAQWKGVIEFVNAVDGTLMTSFAWSPGTRDAAGVWTPEQARQLVRFTSASGGRIDAAEFVNEPNYAANGAAPAGYDGAAFGRDVAAFRRFFKDAVPDAVFLGPGSAGEGGILDSVPVAGRLTSEELLKPTSPAFDAFSYHIYNAVSQRCARGAPAMGTTPEAALTEEWLSRADRIHAFYAKLRDRFEPGKPLWVTEMADAACGGNPWASTFLDTFRYLNQYGRLARHGVQVAAHNTLVASDYGLIDEATLAPRPNFWAAVLWQQLMGTGVLDPGPAATPGLYTYAHCLRGQPGGVAVLAINTGEAPAIMTLSTAADRFTLTANELQSRTVMLNGEVLEPRGDGSVPRLRGRSQSAGQTSLPPTSISFLAFPDAGNPACR